jgi:predicted transcriptional regulator
MDDDQIGLLITGAFIFAVMICSPWSGLIHHGYIVTPATEEDIKNAPPSDTYQLSWWEVPPHLILISLLSSIAPVFVFPVEFFFFLKMFSSLGYRKIASTNVLKSPARSQIYESIRTNPGISFSDLARITGMKRATMQYHLALLKMTGKITPLSARQDTRYFENSDRYSFTEQMVLRSLQNPREKEIFECLLENPAMTRKDLLERLRISGASVSWHTGKMSEDNLLTVTKEGRNARYVIRSDVQELLEKYLRNPTGNTPA